MRDLKRNKQKIYYSNLGDTTEYDEDGNEVQEYGEPVSYQISISTGNSYSNGEVFGRDISYDREMRISDLGCPINEFSRLWIDNNPETEEYDYKVVAVVTSLNSKTYAIKKVNVSAD